MAGLTHIISLLITGLSAGMLGGLLGIGGGVVVLPILIFIFRYPLPVAIGTNITATILTAASGAAGHLRLKNVDYPTARIVAAGGALGAATGSIIFLFITNRLWLLNLILGFAFLSVSIRMVYEGVKRTESERKVNRFSGSIIVKVAVGFFIGLLTGLVGLGGGYALVPSFIYLLGFPVRMAVGTSLTSLLGMALVSGVFKLYQGVVDVKAALCLGIGSIIGAQLGARLTRIIPSWAIRAIFGIVFFYVSLRFIWQGCGGFLQIP